MTAQNEVKPRKATRKLSGRAKLQKLAELREKNDLNGMFFFARKLSAEVPDTERDDLAAMHGRIYDRIIQERNRKLTYYGIIAVFIAAAVGVLKLMITILSKADKS